MKKKNTKKRLLIGACIIMMLLLSGVIILSNLKIKEEKENSILIASLNKAERNGKPEKEQNQKSTNTTINDWNLILVNKENYLPKDYKIELAEIENGYKVDKRIWESLSNMLKDARKEGLKPWICSSYRKPEVQEKLYQKKVNYYKNQGLSEKVALEKASEWVAIPKTSEHELGLSIDIVSKDYQLLDKTQETTKEQKWLMENCHRYGFVMRYPTEKKQITKINYEPWHYRYVGIENAKKMKENNFCLEEYIEYLKEKEK